MKSKESGRGERIRKSPDTLVSTGKQAVRQEAQRLRVDTVLYVNSEPVQAV